MCARGVSLTSVSMIFRLDLWAVPIVWYLLFLILFEKVIHVQLSAYYMYISVVLVSTSKIFNTQFHHATSKRPNIWVRVRVFSASFNNISVISWRSVFIGGGNWCTRRKPPTCSKSLKNFSKSTCYCKTTDYYIIKRLYRIKIQSTYYTPFSFIMSLCEEVVTDNTNFAPPLFIEVSLPSQLLCHENKVQD
jgi:hypothetical protein